jgi:bifunctional DNA-binding transcriptional regulator/antitoxin component of YhaV-PrlF toxin-antitoxin module
MQTFRTTLHQTGNNTGIVVPPEVVEALGAGKKPKVAVTVNGFAYRSSIATMGGTFMISFSSDKREATGLKGGDPIEVTVALDTAPREVDIPPDFATALVASPAAGTFFSTLSYSGRLRHVLSITDAKTDETRQKRIAKAIEALEAGKKV